MEMKTKTDTYDLRHCGKVKTFKDIAFPPLI